jgi:DNA-binding NtrC family response regulator
MKQKPNILLIEDDPIFSKIFARDARNKGLECTTCSNVNEIADLLNFDFKTIVIDYNLGTDSHCNGLDLAKLFSNLDSRTPIVLVSSSERHEIEGSWPFQVKQFVCKKGGVEKVVNSVVQITSQSA